MRILIVFVSVLLLCVGCKMGSNESSVQDKKNLSSALSDGGSKTGHVKKIDKELITVIADEIIENKMQQVFYVFNMGVSDLLTDKLVGDELVVWKDSNAGATVTLKFLRPDGTFFSLSVMRL